MVNSGWCKRPALAVAEHVGEGEQPRLAGGQQLLAGELGRGVEVEAATRPCRRPRRARSRRRAGAPRCRARPAGSRGRPRRSRAPRTSAAVPPGSAPRPSRNGRRSAWTSRCHQGDVALMRAGRLGTCLDQLRRFRGKGTATLATGAPLRLFRSRKEHHGEGHCQLAAQGQRRRSRRQALRRPDGAEHPSRQGHARHPARPAPDQRRGEDLRALPHHRAGRARVRRIAGAQLPLRGRRGLPLHEPAELRAGRGAPRT